MVAPEIVYQTNIEEGRSRNFEASRILFFMKDIYSTIIGEIII